MPIDTPSIAIVDYGLGNLHSIACACERVGLTPQITADKQEILNAAAVILPGVGAYGDAMDNLKTLDLVSPIRQFAQTERPLIGICLGFQLLMSESEEFGCHKGLDIIQGRAVRFKDPYGPNGPLKVPQVGWNRIFSCSNAANRCGHGSPLHEVASDAYMYFVHSFYVCVNSKEIELTRTHYGNIEFCSGIQANNIIGFQFHPERSGPEGMKIYHNIAAGIKRKHLAKENRYAA